jgi:hypothetical protein
MKTYSTLIQTSARNFDVVRFNAESESRLYPQTSKIGICVAIRESNESNEKYLFELAENMTNELK